MLKTNEAEHALNRLAEALERRVQTGSEGPEIQGWGQFLDIPRSSHQIGLYGTSAGVIALALGNRRDSPVIRSAANTLVSWWEQRSTDTYAKEKLSQNLRIAMLIISLRLARLVHHVKIVEALEDEVFLRQLESGLWSDWWIDRENHDRTDRPFTSSILVISLLVFRVDSISPKRMALLKKAIEKIHEILSASKELSDIEIAACLTALSIWQGGYEATKIPRLKVSVNRSDPYFFDFQYEKEGHGSATLYGRDYFIAPTNLMLITAGLQTRARSGSRLLAENLIKSVVANLESNGYFFRLKGDRLLSTANQAWAAIALSAAAQERNPIGLISKLTFALVKERRENAVNRILFPIFSMLAISCLNLLSLQAELWIRLITTVGFLFIAGIYGPGVFKRILPR